MHSAEAHEAITRLTVCNSVCLHGLGIERGANMQVGAAGAAEDHAGVCVARPRARRLAAVAPLGGGLRLGDYLPHRGELLL